jgi:hypothetical protein
MSKTKPLAVTTAGKQRKQEQNIEPHCWKPGQSGNPAGRPKGSRHKLSEEFIRALAEDFENHGKDAIVKMREDRPGDYIRVIASLMPKDLNLNVNEYEHWTDEQLADRLEKLNRELEPYMRSMGRRQ